MPLNSSKEIIADLQNVCWSPAQSTSKLLTSAGVRHGFSGVGAEHPSDTHHAKQVHGTALIEASSACTSASAKDRPEADGVWTREPGLCVAVKTADCLPVLMASTDRKFVMAIHGGWRGVVAGILPEAVRFLSHHLNLKPNSLIACIGPSIGHEAFEVGPEVIGATQTASFCLDGFAAGLTMSKGQNDRWHFDLQTAAVLQLMTLGVPSDQIEVIGACTKSLAGQWHSYRREGKGCGSNWSWIRVRD